MRQLQSDSNEYKVKIVFLSLFFNVKKNFKVKELYLPRKETAI
jgi:hypothetical protein